MIRMMAIPLMLIFVAGGVLILPAASLWGIPPDSEPCSKAEPISAPGDSAKGGESEPFDQISFPYVLRIPPGHVLIVHGRQMPDIVTLTWQPGDSLRIEGIAIYPNPRIPHRVFSEEELDRIYKGVPFVARRVREGASWHEAVKAYYERQAEMERKAISVYRATLDSTGSPESASREVLRTLDRSLLLPGSEPGISNGTMDVVWDCDPRLPIQLIDLDPSPIEPWPPASSRVSPERMAKDRAFEIIRWAEPNDHTPCLMEITPSGMMSR